MKFQSHFAHDVHEARKKSKWTQEQVAEAVGICLREYQKIEQGIVCPGTQIFLKLLFFFHLDVESYKDDDFRRGKKSSDQA